MTRHYSFRAHTHIFIPHPLRTNQVWTYNARVSNYPQYNKHQVRIKPGITTQHPKFRGALITDICREAAAAPFDATRRSSHVVSVCEWRRWRLWQRIVPPLWKRKGSTHLQQNYTHTHGIYPSDEFVAPTIRSLMKTRTLCVYSF